MILLNCENLNPVIFDRLQLLTKNPTYRSKWEIIRAMPEAHYCGKSVGNSSAQTAETIVNTGSLPHRRHFAVANKQYLNHAFLSLYKCLYLYFLFTLHKFSRVKIHKSTPLYIGFSASGVLNGVLWQGFLPCQDLFLTIKIFRIISPCFLPSVSR